MASSPDLFGKRLILVLGKGGVGRTTIAAALAQRLAARGRDTLLYQANAKETLSRLFDGRPVNEHITRIGSHLFAVNTNPNAALHEYALMVLRFETLYRVVFENKVARALLRAIPGLDDYSIMGKLWYHTTETESDGTPRWDTVVFDAPATGHALNMLRIPTSILATVPRGPLTRDAEKVRALLSDPERTAVVLTTLAEDLPCNEAIEAHAVLTEELEMPVSHLVVNRLYPDRFMRNTSAARLLEGVDPAALSPRVAAMFASAGTIQKRRALNDKYLLRLRERLALPELHVPFLFTSAFGSDELARVGAVLEEQLAALPVGRFALR